MITHNHKIFKNIINKKKSKYILSLRRNTSSRNDLNIHHRSCINNYKKIIINENNTKSTNIYSYNNLTKSNNTILSRDKNFSTNNNIPNNSIDEKRIAEIYKRYNFKNYKKKKAINYCQTELNKAENNNKGDKICLLPKYFKVKNFNIKTSKIIDYLELNKNNNFFQYDNNSQKTKKINKLSNKRKFIKKAKSDIELNKLKKIEEIYPTILNIEGQRNRQLISELDYDKRKKRKIEGINYPYNKQNLEFRKKILKERNKIEEYAKVNLSNLAYKRQVLILSMKLYQKSILHLRRKNSFKFNLDLPLYNIFLNLD